jgi:fatty acid desaturase
MHHTYTNVVGKDRDVGYGTLRMSEEQRWHPYYLGNPLWNALLAVFFQWGVALHDIEIEKIVAGEKDRRTVWSPQPADSTWAFGPGKYTDSCPSCQRTW